MLDAAGLSRRRSTLTDDLDRAVDGADFVLDPDPRRRPGGAARATRRSRSPAAASARRRPAPAASPRRCAPCRSCSRSPSASRELAAPDAWIVDFTNPVGIVTRALLDAGHRAIGLCNVAIGFQRAFARAARRRAGARRRRPGRAQPPDVGARACSLDGDDVLPELLADARRRARRATSSCRARLLDELGAVPSYYLRYFYAHDEVLAEQLDGVPRAQTVAEIERELLELYRDPTLDREAGAARAARRRVLQRGGDRARRVARRRTTARCTRSTCATTARSPGSPTTTSSRCRRASTRDGAEPAAAGAARARAARARRSTSPPTSGSPSRRRSTRDPVDGAQGAARASADRPGTRMVEALLDAAALAEAAAAMSARPRGRRRQLEDRPRARRAPTARCSRSRAARCSSPHHLGLDGCARRARRRCSTEAAAPRRAPSPRSRSCCSPASTSPTRRSALQRRRVDARGWAARVDVGNDTFAVLRAGTERGWGVAVVCGAGINCVGVAPDGRARALPGARRDHRRLGRRLRRRARRASRPRRAARTAAARRRRSSSACPAHFGLRDAARARRGDPPRRDPAARACSSSRRSSSPRPRDDAVAAEIVDRLADEVVALARVALDAARPRRDEPVEVLLGGGLLQARRRAPARARSSRACARSARSSPCAPTRVAADRRRRAARPRRARRRRRRRRRGSRERARGRGRTTLRPEVEATMADVRFEQATRIYPGTDAPAVDALDLAHRATASSWCSSARRAPARRPRCGCSPGSRRSTPARSASATATSPTSRRRTATSRWCSRTTRSTRT